MRTLPPVLVSAVLLAAGVVAEARSTGSTTASAALPALTAVPASATATATPQPGAGFCTVTGEQAVAPASVPLGQPASLAITIRAHCPAEARGRSDIVLVVDHSSSMADGGKYEASAEAVRQFVAGVDLARHRVGLVLFNEQAWVAQPLTDRGQRVLDAFAASGAPTGATDIADALSMAEEEFALHGRPEAVPIIVLMTDGRSDADDMLAAAAACKDVGTVIFAVGLGADAEQDALRRAASTPEHYYFSPGPEGLAEIYQRIATMIRQFSVTNVTLYDQLAPWTEFVPGSGQPDEPSLGPPLAWRRPFLLEEDTSLTYDVLVSRAGLVRPSTHVWAEFTDGDGVLRRIDIQPAELEVVAPEVHQAWLPLAWRDACHPTKELVDVALTIDTSSSMAGDKLAQAVKAAQSFTHIVDSSSNRVAVVRYDQTSALVQPLTSDRTALEAALGGLATGEGTRIDHGLEISVAELVGERARPGDRLAVILLSDGRQVEEPERAQDWAEVAWARGIAVYTIALGADADREFLLRLADRADHAYYAPTADELQGIYVQLLGAVRCR